MTITFDLVYPAERSLFYSSYQIASLNFLSFEYVCVCTRGPGLNVMCRSTSAACELTLCQAYACRRSVCDSIKKIDSLGAACEESNQEIHIYRQSSRSEPRARGNHFLLYLWESNSCLSLLHLIALPAML